MDDPMPKVQSTAEYITTLTARLSESEQRGDALAETVRALRDVVTRDHESKAEFVARVRSILSADPDDRLSSLRAQYRKEAFEEAETHLRCCLMHEAAGAIGLLAQGEWKGDEG